MLLSVGALYHLNLLEIGRHPWFVSAFLAAGSAQFLKFAVASVRSRTFAWRNLFAAGGMPSMHSALVSSLSFSVGFTEGFDEPYAMIAVGLGLIVLVDAVTLRRQAGNHARMLNEILGRLDNLSASDRLKTVRLDEQLGHNRREMLAGVCCGALIAFVVCAVWDFWK